MKNTIAIWTANALPLIGVVLGIVASGVAGVCGASDAACAGILIVTMAASFAASILIVRWFGLIDSGL